MEREPQTPRERAGLLLRAALLPGWHPTPGQRLVWATRGAIVLGVLVLVYFIVSSIVHKSLWAWLDLLIVPAVLAIGGYLFARSENRATRVAAEQRAQDEALQAYLDQMGQLLLDKDRPLQQSEEGSAVRTVARARTLAVLRRLDRLSRGNDG